MAVFTTISRGKGVWQGTNPEPLSSEAYELLIADTYKLNIGNGYNLTITPERIERVWTRPARSLGPRTAPPVSTVVSFLNIGDGYNLLINDSDQLVIGDTNPGANWTTLTKL